MLTVSAPIKLNLMLHVVKRTQGGFHHLQSLMLLKPGPDTISIGPGKDLTFTLGGTFGHKLSLENNTVVQAIHFFECQGFVPKVHAHVHLEKNVPVASGMGGGSANAAAVIYALILFYKISLNGEQQKKLVQQSGLLGADVPVCLAHLLLKTELFWLDGTGKEGCPKPLYLPTNLFIVCVNPLVPLSTPAIFKGFQEGGQPYAKPIQEPKNNLLSFLENTNNTLTPFAKVLVPEIDDILITLSRQPGCLLARMTGSGASCFGVFKSQMEAERACKTMQPPWYFAMT